MEHWSNEFEHASLSTPEAKESFSSAMSKYATQEEALIGGFNAIKATGKPYKLPESLDKLPDDNVRKEFKTNAMKVLGIEDGVSDIKSLDDVDFKANLAEGLSPDENLITATKQFAVKEKIPIGILQKFVSFHNQAMAQAKAAYEQAQKAQTLEAATKTDEALIAHFGSKEKVAEQSELVRRAFKDLAGLTADEYVSVGLTLANSPFTNDPVLTRALIKLIAPLAAEGTTNTGESGKTAEKPNIEKQTTDEMPNTSKALGWIN